MYFKGSNVIEKNTWSRLQTETLLSDLRIVRGLTLALALVAKHAAALGANVAALGVGAAVVAGQLYREGDGKGRGSK